MENYTKSPKQNEIQEPLHNVKLDSNVLHMHVKVGSKIKNLMTFACSKFEKDDLKQITWNGNGDALNKVVACAEIMKKEYQELNLYQINKIGAMKVEEVWNSKLPDLRDIKVTKEIPSMCIILSKTPLDPNEPGYQTRNTLDELFSKKPKTKQTQNNKKIDEHNLEEDGIYVKKKKLKEQNSDNK